MLPFAASTIAKLLLGKKMVGRGGGDQIRPHISENCPLRRQCVFNQEQRTETPVSLASFLESHSLEHYNPIRS